ncbi:MAG: hypothetical protein Kow00106_20610 [Anaerolineae bacterium]
MLPVSIAAVRARVNSVENTNSYPQWLWMDNVVKDVGKVRKRGKSLAGETLTPAIYTGEGTGRLTRAGES